LPEPEDPDLALLRDAAHAAGMIARRHFRTEMHIEHKPGGAGPVSVADIEIDTMLRNRLLAARPGYGWLSEETPDSRARQGASAVFIVDPIDGTRAFIDGQESFAHSLAVAHDGVITAAVVYLPQMDQLFEAVPGGGARLNDTPIRARDAALEGARVLAGKPQLAPELWPGGVPPVERHFRPSLAWRMCLVAEGRFDAMITLRDAWEWDIAAGALIAEEAGARVSDRHGKPLRFNSEAARSPGVLAAGPAIHAGLLARLV